MNFLTIFIILAIFLIIIYYIFRQIKFNQLFQQELHPQQQQKSKTKSFNWLLPFSNSNTKKRIKKIKQKHHQKVQEQQLDEVFNEFSNEPTKITSTHFHRLKSLVHTYERHHQKDESFQNLDHLITKLNEWEENKPLSKKEKQDIIQELRKIAKKE